MGVDVPFAGVLLMLCGWPRCVPTDAVADIMEGN